MIESDLHVPDETPKRSSSFIAGYPAIIVTAILGGIALFAISLNFIFSDGNVSDDNVSDGDINHSSHVKTASNDTSASQRLAAQLYAEYPELDPSNRQSQTVDDWQRVIRLRDFSYRHTAYANAVNSDAYRAGSQMVERVRDRTASLADAYAFFDAGQGGVVCGDSAEMLRQLYTWAGFDSWYLSIGFNPPTPLGSRFTHALTMVRIEVAEPQGSRSILTVHDPSINSSYVDSDGRPIDYFDMLALLKQRKAAQIHHGGAVAGAIRRSDPITVAFGSEIEQRRPEDFVASWNVGSNPTWMATTEGGWKFIGPRTNTAFERLGEEWWKQELSREGYPSETIYLHCQRCQPFLVNLEHV